MNISVSGDTRIENFGSGFIPKFFWRFRWNDQLQMAGSSLRFEGVTELSVGPCRFKVPSPGYLEIQLDDRVKLTLVDGDKTEEFVVAGGESAHQVLRIAREAGLLQIGVNTIDAWNLHDEAAYKEAAGLLGRFPYLKLVPGLRPMVENMLQHGVGDEVIKLALVANVDVRNADQVARVLSYA